MKIKFLISFCLLLLSFTFAEEKIEVGRSIKEDFSETTHSVKIQGKEIPYKATAGNLIINDEKGKDTASLFFVAYTKENNGDTTKRPITFCFNGGPGTASIWLNIGVFGPRKINWDESSNTAPPYEMIDNNQSILDLTDLVFIDPVSTGHSTASPGQDPKQFYGVDEDIKSVASFIRQYLTRYKRWDSPKFIAGESYGTTRAAGLSHQLQDDFGIYLNGVIFISSVLDFQTKMPSTCNDLPYMLYLPTYAATAWYYKMLPNQAQKDLDKLLKEAEEFALGEYALALLKGDKLSLETRGKIVSKLASFTGLSSQYIERSNLRIDPLLFAKEILKDQNRVVGRFDSRFKGIDIDVCRESHYYDPSFTKIIGVFTGAFNEYLLSELKWTKPDQYFVFANVYPWNWGKANQAVDMVEHLQRAMVENPDLTIFVASGVYDLATPYYATKYTFDHLGIDPSLAAKVSMHTYEAGHMMYLSPKILIKLRQDLEEFYKKSKR